MKKRVGEEGEGGGGRRRCPAEREIDGYRRKVCEADSDPALDDDA